MKKRLKLVAIALVILISGIAIWFFCQPAEPTYKGRTLTSYLRGPWEQIDGPQTENPHYAPNEVAIRAIGTNGIPTLLRLIKAHDPPWKTKAIRWLNGQKLVHINIPEATERRELGRLGFLILGDMAKPAAPDLGQLVQGTDPELSTLAAVLLLKLDAGIDAHIAAFRGILKNQLMGDFLTFGEGVLASEFKSRFPSGATNQIVRELLTAPTEKTSSRTPTNSQPPK